MKTKIRIGVVLAFLAACSTPQNKEAQTALIKYTTFVDSVFNQNAYWKTTIDTEFVEVPIDPTDPMKVRLDTIVTPPESKTTLLKTQYLATPIFKLYNELEVSVESNLSKMDEDMKKEYVRSKQKFESMK